METTIRGTEGMSYIGDGRVAYWVSGQGALVGAIGVNGERWQRTRRGDWYEIAADVAFQPVLPPRIFE